MIKEYNKKYWKCKKPNRILVEVDPEKNCIDLDVISGWKACNALSNYDIEKYQIDFEKEYWWINWWNFKESKIYFLKNE